MSFEFGKCSYLSVCETKIFTFSVRPPFKRVVSVNISLIKSDRQSNFPQYLWHIKNKIISDPT